VLLAPRAARAQSARRDDAGLWAFGALSAGVGAGSYRFTGLSLFAPRRELRLEAEMHPAPVTLSGAFGYHFTRYTALGVMGDVTGLQANTRLAETTIGAGYLVSLGLSGELRFMPEGAFAVWQLGFARAGFSGDTEDLGAADNIVTLDTLTGYVEGVRVGWSFGAIAPVIGVRRVELSARGGQTTFRLWLFDVGVALQKW
jgi:hypothetical protein